MRAGTLSWPWAQVPGEGPRRHLGKAGPLSGQARLHGTLGTGSKGLSDSPVCPPSSHQGGQEGLLGRQQRGDPALPSCLCHLPGPLPGLLHREGRPHSVGEPHGAHATRGFPAWSGKRVLSEGGDGSLRHLHRENCSELIMKP